MVSGMIRQEVKWGNTLRMAFLFGLFQALMPLLGWVAIHFFQHSVEAYDHWIAFGLLAIVGIKMIVDAFSSDEDAHLDTSALGTQIVLAIATSIDAMAVGISMACTGYSSASQLPLPLVIIGIASFALSIAGTALGARYGDLVARKIRPELLGGIILLAIGVKILFEHLLA